LKISEGISVEGTKKYETSEDIKSIKQPKMLT
jgi:hypothetical protein